MKYLKFISLLPALALATIQPEPVRSEVVNPSPLLRAASPAENPNTAARVALGRLLFWDPVLSGHKDVACATCHHPDYGYSDGLRLSIGVNGTGLGNQREFIAGAAASFAKRNSQTVLNAGFNGVTESGSTSAAMAPMFWDLRVSGLEAQALEPIKSAEEMRGDAYSEAAAVDAVVDRLRATPGYVALFKAAFGGGAPVSAQNLARALAAFERTLVAVDSPYDRYMRGDQSAMTATQIAGMEAFARTGCTGCHSGPMFSDYRPHVLGTPESGVLPVPDQGMNGTHAFRTPSLRNLALTGPYMHSGSIESLDDVLQFYNRVGRGQGRGRGRGDGVATTADGRLQIDPLLRELRGVRRNSEEIKAFLLALNDDGFDRSVPAQVPSGLRPGGRIN